MADNEEVRSAECRASLQLWYGQCRCACVLPRLQSTLAAYTHRMLCQQPRRTEEARRRTEATSRSETGALLRPEVNCCLEEVASMVRLLMRLILACSVDRTVR